MAKAAKALSFTIAQYPEHEAFITAKWSADGDFEEICQHFCWMSEAAELNAGTPAGKRYETPELEISYDPADWPFANRA